MQQKTTHWQRSEEKHFFFKDEHKERFADRVKTWRRIMETGRWRGNGKGEQGTGLTYMRWEGLQGGDTLLWVGTFSFMEIGLQARAGLIHRHGPTGSRRLPAFQGWGAGGLRVVWTAGDLINIGCDLPPERGVLTLQRLQLEEMVSNTLRRALSKAGCVPCPDLFCPYRTPFQFLPHCSSIKPWQSATVSMQSLDSAKDFI